MKKGTITYIQNVIGHRIECPHCNSIIEDVIYGFVDFGEYEEGQEVICPECNEEFIIANQEWEEQ